jgi:hypothetical protein
MFWRPWRELLLKGFEGSYDAGHHAALDVLNTLLLRVPHDTYQLGG